VKIYGDQEVLKDLRRSLMDWIDNDIVKVADWYWVWVGNLMEN
jgi:hypothetical protein